MPWKATAVDVDEKEATELESWVRKGTTEQRYVQRARIVLEAAAGKTTREIAIAWNCDRPPSVNSAPVLVKEEYRRWPMRLDRGRHANMALTRSDIS